MQKSRQVRSRTDWIARTSCMGLPYLLVVLDGLWAGTSLPCSMDPYLQVHVDPLKNAECRKAGK